MKDVLQRAYQFVKEAIVELKKVTWPVKKETIASTTVVIIAVFVIAFFLSLIDLSLARIIKRILS